MIEPPLERFLTDHLLTRQIRHSGRDFHTHLKGTHDLLKAWGNPAEICHAGLFHSVYGTTSFKRKVVPLDRRDIVRALIGPHAEFLVYVFCVTRRPAAFLALADSAAGQLVVHDRYAQQPIALSPQDLDGLLEIEAANLCEQGGRVSASLRVLLRSRISPAAKRHIGSVLAPIHNWPPQRGVWRAEIRPGRERVSSCS
jgi:hypothetical protein